jgi:hypothetical protein
MVTACESGSAATLTAAASAICGSGGTDGG